jgi:hypothetical protein
MTRFLFACILLFFVTISRSSAQTANASMPEASSGAQPSSGNNGNSVVKDPHAATIAQAALFAAGTAPGGIVLKGHVNMPGISSGAMDIVLEFNGSSQMRSLITTPKGNVLWVIRDGQGAVRQASGRVRHLSGNNTMFYRPMQIPSLSHLSETTNPNVSVEDVGTDQVNGTAVLVIGFSLQPPAGTDPHLVSEITRTLYDIDPTTGHVLRVRAINVAENNSNARQKLETLFSDYRTVNGVSIPFRQQMFADGSLRQDLTVDTAEIGVSLPDSDFVLPN